MSSRIAEQGAEFLGLINRLRANSSLVLVALEHDDMRRLQELVQECDGLVKQIVEGRSEELPADIKALIAQVIETNRRVVEELETKKLEVTRQLAEVRAQRVRVREAKATVRRPTGASVLDRVT